MEESTQAPDEFPKTYGSLNSNDKALVVGGSALLKQIDTDKYIMLIKWLLTQHLMRVLLQRNLISMLFFSYFSSLLTLFGIKVFYYFDIVHFTALLYKI